MTEQKWHGVFTALATPFKNSKIDFASWEKLISFQEKNGINGFVVGGTTGESPTISDDELKELFLSARKTTKLPLIVGTGSNSTASTIAKTKSAFAMGADAALIVTPYYNKPPQRGMLQHFLNIAGQSSGPIFLYNVPGRTGVSLSVESIVKLSQHPKIIGIKEASGDLKLAKAIKEQCAKDFILLSGDDATYFDFLEFGTGVISVASHIMPKQFVSWTKKTVDKKDFEKYLPLINFLFVEANPIPLKKALQLMQIFESAELRSPLAELEAANTQELQAKMQTAGLL